MSLHLSPLHRDLLSFLTRRSSDLPRGHVVRRRLGREAEARLSLGQHGERFPLRVILEPGLSCEEAPRQIIARSEEHTSELQSLRHLVCRLLLEKKNKQT